MAGNAVSKGEVRAPFYDSAMGDFIAWFSSADRLKAAAELVLAGVSERERHAQEGIPDGFVAANAQPDLRGVYLYLAFLTVENLIKGIWIRENEGSVSGGTLPKEIDDHSILRLCEKVGLTLNQTELDFVELARNVDSLGRYPGPKSHSQDLVLPDDLDLMQMAATFEQLYWRLVGVLMEGVEDG